MGREAALAAGAVIDPLTPEALAASLGWPKSSKLRWHRAWGFPREQARGWWLEDQTWPRCATPAGSAFFTDERLGVVTDDAQEALSAALRAGHPLDRRR